MAAYEQAPPLDFHHWPLVRRIALALYFGALILWSTKNGIPTQRELVVLWTCGALVCVSLGRHPRQILQLVLDWLPILLIMAAYDFTRGAADTFGIGVHTTMMIDFDQALFFGQTPTEWIQAQLGDPDVVQWWDVAFSIVYTSYFIVPFATAGVLWARNRPDFLKFSKRLVTLAIAGLATYILFPAAPPWMAGEQGLLEGVQRTTADGFASLDVGTAALFSKGQQNVNLVAAVPSLHAGFTALVAMFLWSRVGRKWRPLVVAYPLAMAFTLMATGEHYFFDIVLGWGYAGAVMLAWGWWERRRKAAAGNAGAAEAEMPLQPGCNATASRETEGRWLPTPIP